MRWRTIPCVIEMLEPPQPDAPDGDDVVARLHDLVADDANPAVASTRAADTTRLELALMVRDVARKLHVAQPMRVLEIGCGTGIVGCSLASRCREYVGIDVAGRALTTFRRSAEEAGVANKVTLLQTNWLSLTDEALRSLGTFDAVVAYAMLHLVPQAPDRASVIERAMSTLKPGGQILLGCLPLEDWSPRVPRAATLLNQSFVLGKRIHASASRRLHGHHRLDAPRSLPTGFAEALTRSELELVLRRLGSPPHQWKPLAPGVPFHGSRTDLVIEAVGDTYGTAAATTHRGATRRAIRRAVTERRGRTP